MHDQFRFRRVRVWLLASMAVLCLLTTSCNQENSPSASASSPSASPSLAASATPAASSMTPGSPTPSPEATGSPAAGAQSEAAKLYPKFARLEGKATVVMTVKGKPITLEIDGVNAPITAGNFVDLVDKKFYDGLVFHRVVRQPTPFVVQGGDPKGRDPNVPIESLGTGGYIDPKTNSERYIPLEIKSEDGKTPYGKTFDLAGMASKPKLQHKRGVLAMARSAYPDSASAQFYITLADLSFLDGNYAVFGSVTQGMEVVDSIQQGDRIDSARVTQGLDNLKNRQ